MTSREAMKCIGEDILTRCPDRYKISIPWPGTGEAFRLDVPAFTTEYLKLYRMEHSLSMDGSIPMACVFQLQQYVDIYIQKRERSFLSPLKDTILLDPDNVHPRLWEMDADCHQILARMGLHHPEPVLYRHIGKDRTPEEQEADTLASYLLMPDSVLLPMLRHRNYQPVSYTDHTLLHTMARHLNVPVRSLLSRLKDAGLLEDQ